MAMIETWFSQDLNEPVQVHQLDGNVFSQDNQGNLIGVNVFDGDEPATLSGSVSASVIRSDGSTVAVTGVLSGNSCYVILPAAAYAVPGIISIVIKLTGGGSTTTLCAVVANVYQSATDATVDPGTIIPSIQDLIDAIDEAVATIPPEYSEIVDALCYTISPPIYINKQNAKNRYISLKGTKAAKDTVINISGNPEAGSGSGNNWISDFLKIPSDKLNIFVILPGAYWCLAFYDKNFNFLSFYNDNNIPNINGNVLTEVSIINNAEYIRFGFYSGNGYTDEKYYDLFRAYSIVPNYKINPSEIARCLPWGYTSPDAQRNIITATNTIGTMEFVKFSKPVVASAENGYKIAVVLKDPNSNGNTVSEWFPNPEQGSLFIPAGIDVWIGVRPVYGNATVILPEDISQQIRIEYIESEIVFHAPSITNVKNGYIPFGQMIHDETSQYYSHRVGSVEYLRAEEDTLFHITNGLSVFTLAMYSGDEIDFADGSNWTVYYSRDTDVIIPAGSFYCYSAGLTIVSDELVAKQSYQIIPLTKTAIPPTLTPFVESLISNMGSLGKRISALENNTVPAYYETHLTSKINAINALYSDSTDQFIFITDVHINGYGGNTGHSKALINRISFNTAVSKVINGGDLINRPSLLVDDAKTYRDTLTLISESASYTRPDTGIPQFMVIGNHDSGVDYNNGVRVPNTITVDDFMAYSGLNVTKPLVCSDVKSGTQYYFDHNGIRYIIINPNLRDEIPTGEGFGHSWEFLANVALLSMPAGYHAIIIPHVFVDGENEPIPSFTQTILDTADAYNSRGVATYGGLSANYADCEGLVACFIAGHAHMDFDIRTTGNIPVIFTTTDNMRAEKSGSGLSRTEGTVSEQAFDVFSIDKTNKKIYATRIGAGSDREFSY